MFQRLKRSGKPYSLQVLKSVVLLLTKIRDFLLKDYHQSYAEMLQDIVINRLGNLSEDDIRLEERNITHDIILGLENFCHVDDSDEVYGTGDLFSLKLSVALQFLKSRYLEKKITGLTDIKSYLTTQHKFSDDLHPKLLSDDNSDASVEEIGQQNMLQWVQRNKLIDYLFGDNSHPELMKRSKEIIYFLAVEGKLTAKDVDMIWESQVGKHETIRHMIWGLLGELANVLDLEIIDFLFDKLKQINYNEYNSNLLFLVRELTVSGIQKYSPCPEDEKKWYGIDIYWEITQDESEAAIEVKHQAHLFLFNFLVWDLCHSQKLRFVKLSVDNVKSNRSVLSSLRIIQELIYTISRDNKDISDSPMIQYLVKENIVDLVENNLTLYKTQCSEIIRQQNIDPSKVSQTTFCGNYNYISEIQCRLDFIKFISKHVRILRSHLDMFWLSTMDNPLSTEERDYGFKWIQEMGPTEQGGQFTLSNEDREYLFEKIEKSDLIHLSEAGWNTLEYYFRCINWILGKYNNNEDPNVWNVNTLELFGLDCIWRVALETENEAVGSSAISRLCDLYTNFPKSTDASIVLSFREEFIRRIMSNLPKENSESVELSTLTLKVGRCLELIKAILEACEVSSKRQKHGISIKRTIKPKPEDKKIDLTKLAKMIGPKEAPEIEIVVKDSDNAPMEIDEGRPEITQENLLPSQIIAQREEYFGQLVSLLSLPHPNSNRVWKLLMELPTNLRMYNQILKFEEDNLESLFDSKNIYMLLYTLQIIDKIVQTENVMDEWKKRFESLRGVQIIVNVLRSGDFSSDQQREQRKMCLALLVKVIAMFLLEPNDERFNFRILPSLVKNYDTSISLSELILKILEITAIPEELLNKETAQTSGIHIPYEQLFDFSLPLIVACVIKGNHIQEILGYPLFDQWILNALLKVNLVKIREYTRIALYQIFVVNKEPQIDVFVKKLLSFIDMIYPTFNTCDQYFRLIRDIVIGYTDIPVEVVQTFLEKMIIKIQEHPIIEMRGSLKADTVLIGMMRTITVILHRFAQFKSLAGPLIPEIFDRCLLSIASPENNGLLAPPVCKTPTSRQAAFNLLKELSDGCPENYTLLIDRVIALHQSRSHSIDSWNYQPSGFEKSSSGYVGLRNLGATCYMNSLMQQLYMIPQFRSNILQIQNPNDEEKVILIQLQAIFANLQESEKNFYNTEPFCSVYNYNGEPMNTRVQMDADEFFSTLFEKLEKAIKGTPYQKVLKEYFGGVINNQIASLECEHKSERHEDFFTLSVDIKNKKRLEESLELYIQADLLEGENKYKCDKCNKRVDAKKRCFIQELPNNLIIHLKRFDFDLESLSRSKINDYCEFPMKLNIEPFTKDGIERKEKGETVDPAELIQYDYDLSGIIVHTGTAEFGHYYSFIKERKDDDQGEQWFCFNDKSVEPFDPQEIPHQCFGGFESGEMENVYQRGQRRLKQYSAYMLFYTKKIPNNLSVQRTVDRNQLAKSVPRDLYLKTWEENTTFLTDKYLFEPEYLKFATSLTDISTKMSFTQTPHKGLEFGTRFFVETLSYAKDKSMLPNLMTTLNNLYMTYPKSARWLLSYMTLNPGWITSILFDCTITETRLAFVDLISTVLTTLYVAERDSLAQDLDEPMCISYEEGEEPILDDNKPVLPQFLHTCSKLLPLSVEGEFTVQFYTLFKLFTQLGTEMREYMIRKKYLEQFVRFYFSLKSLTDKNITKREKICLKNTSDLVTAIANLICCDNFQPDSSNPSPLLLDPSHIIELLPEEKLEVKSPPFIKRLLQDGVSVASVANIMTHYCWNNLNVSSTIIREISSSIHSLDADYFRAIQDVAFQILSITDDYQIARMKQFLDLYMKVIKMDLQYKRATFVASKFLIELSSAFPYVREYLFDHMSDWIEDLVLYKEYDGVRLVAERIVHTLLPWIDAYEVKLSHLLTLKEDMDRDEELLAQPAPSDTPDPDMVQDRAAQIYQMLINFMPSCRDVLGKVDLPEPKQRLPKSKSVLYSYFRLINWSLINTEDKLNFDPYFPLFMEIFYKVDRGVFEMDFNKLEMIRFLDTLTDENEELLYFIINGVTKEAQMFLEFFISLNVATDCIEYNNICCAHYYNVVKKCCLLDPKFLKSVITHRNWGWGTQYLLLETQKYPNTAMHIIEIIYQIPEQLGSCEHTKENLLLVISTMQSMMEVKLTELPDNCIHVASILTKNSIDDKLFFINKNGMTTLSKMGQKIISKKSGDDSIVECISNLVMLMNDLLDWVDDYPESVTRTSNLEEAKMALLKCAELKPFLLALKSYMTCVTGSQDIMESVEYLSVKLDKIQHFDSDVIS